MLHIFKNINIATNPFIDADYEEKSKTFILLQKHQNINLKNAIFIIFLAN
jgi:hypothetical protein